MKNQVVIRVGEKNNFNQTNAEFKALEQFKDKGLIFVNSNGFTPIKANYPSIVTINPYMTFQPLTGDLSNVKAVRLKMFETYKQEYCDSLFRCIEFCVKNNLPILITYMRFRSTKNVVEYVGDNYKSYYKWEKNYFRPSAHTKKILFQEVARTVRILKGNVKLIHECDSKGQGCPACGNCYKLTYGLENAEIKALNLSISGIADKNGKQGLCPFKCPDCFAKIVTFGKSPACDRLITNKKITGAITHE